MEWVVVEEGRQHFYLPMLPSMALPSMVREGKREANAEGAASAQV